MSLLAASAGIEDVVAVILAEALRVASADRCRVALPGDSVRHLDLAELDASTSGAGDEPDGASTVRRATLPLYADTPLSDVVRTGSRVVRVAEPVAGELYSVVAAFPLDPSSGALGGIAFEWRDGPEPGKGALEELSDFAKLAGLAVERTRLRRRERHLTRAMRGALLGPLDTGPYVEALGAYHPPWSGVPLGGDWYDAFATGDGRVVFVLGDVTGHGVDASPTMLSARTFVRAFMLEDPDPASCLHKLDRAWTAFHDSEGMVSVLLAVLNPQQATLSWLNAGLPAPLLSRAAGGVSQLDGGRARPAGSGMSAEIEVAATVALEPGDVLVAYTDGFIVPSEAGGTEPAAIAATVGAHGEASLRDLVEALADLGSDGEFRTDDASVLAARLR